MTAFDTPEPVPHPPQFAEAGFTVHDDGRVTYTPGHFGAKLGFLLVSLAVLAFGVWAIWDPMSTLLLGESATGRVVRIVRSDPGEADRVIRYRQAIAAGGFGTRFTYFVAVEDDRGERDVYRLAVGSRQRPYEVGGSTPANINERFTVIYRPGGKLAYGLYHHRTWAFGVGFLFVGAILTLCAVPTLWAVGRPIEVDP